jgi:hypothetical protein
MPLELDEREALVKYEFIRMPDSNYSLEGFACNHLLEFFDGSQQGCDPSNCSAGGGKAKRRESCSRVCAADVATDLALDRSDAHAAVQRVRFVTSMSSSGAGDEELGRFFCHG